jgi:hypothetical protein
MVFMLAVFHLPEFTDKYSPASVQRRLSKVMVQSHDPAAQVMENHDLKF